MKNQKHHSDFLLNDIAKLSYGNKFDKNKMTYNNPSVNFVSRTAKNNGISDFVDYKEGVEPFDSGTITLAFGGSVGSTFLQKKPFYTGQNIGVIELPKNISKQAKLYFVSTLEKKCKTLFVAFSDEINKHFKTDLSVSLPSKQTFVPDFQALEDIINSLSLSLAKLQPKVGRV